MADITNAIFADLLVGIDEGQHMVFYHEHKHDGSSIRKPHGQNPNRFLVEYYEDGRYRQYPTSEANDAINTVIEVFGPGPRNVSIFRTDPPSETLIVSELRYQIVPI